MNNLLCNIELAFKNRTKPKLFLLDNQIAEHEYQDIKDLINKHWSEIDCLWLEKHFEFINWLTPEAFCYYLPGILSASIKQREPELIVNHSIIQLLDRTLDINSWDEFFEKRFSMLNIEENKVVQEWLLWLSSFNEISISDSSLSRAFDTLDLLINQKAGAN